MRQGVWGFAESRGEVFWSGNLSATGAEFRGVMRRVVLVRRHGGRCGDGDNLVLYYLAFCSTCLSCLPYSFVLVLCRQLLCDWAYLVGQDLRGVKVRKVETDVESGDTAGDH